MSLTNQLKETIRHGYSSLLESAGFSGRQSQAKMIAEVSKTLAAEYDNSVGVFEGPTGTGKGIAYLLGAIPVAKAMKKQLVVSTATVALQEQLVTKDLPLLATHAGIEFTYALAKGRQRYVCDRNLETASASNQGSLALGEDPLNDALFTSAPNNEDRSQLESMLSARRDGEWDGDLDQWPEPVSNVLLPRLTTGSAGCSNKRCAFYERCSFRGARAGLKHVDVVIANHDLVLSTLSMDSGGMLRSPEETMYVFDEGHHLAEKAINQQAEQIYFPRAEKLLKAIPSIMKLVTRGLSDAETVREEAIAAAEPLRTALGEFRGALIADRETRLTRFTKPHDPVRVSPVSANIEQLAQVVANQSSILLDACTAVLKMAKADEKDKKLGPQLVASVVEKIGPLTILLKSVSQTAQLYANPGVSTSAPIARWTQGEPGRLTVAASPIDASDLLRNRLWEPAAGAIVTSATLQTVGNFNKLSTELGLSQSDGTQYAAFPSPFNLHEQAEFVVANVSADPKVHELHSEQVRRVVEEEAGEGGTLVLFASYRQMNAVFDALSLEVAQRTRIPGRDLSREQLVADHIAAVQQGEKAILFGVQSFAEGLDLPGDQCRTVIIAKLPFTPPDSPIEKTREEWVTAQGRNYFVEESVPRAWLKLVQMIGRLIRTESDTGRIVCCDPRLVTKAYGRKMLATLPPYKQIVQSANASRKAS